jgi:hypothetical protein
MTAKKKGNLLFQHIKTVKGQHMLKSNQFRFKIRLVIFGHTTWAREPYSHGAQPQRERLKRQSLVSRETTSTVTT